MAGLVEKAIKKSIRQGDTLVTPYRGRPFIVGAMSNEYIELLFGEEKTSTKFKWEWLEEAYNYLKNKNWVEIGTKFDVHGVSNTFDQFFRKHINRAVGSWIAAVFEKAGLVEINRKRPNKVRIISS